MSERGSTIFSYYTPVSSSDKQTDLAPLVCAAVGARPICRRWCGRSHRRFSLRRGSTHSHWRSARPTTVIVYCHERSSWGSQMPGSGWRRVLHTTTTTCHTFNGNLIGTWKEELAAEALLTMFTPARQWPNCDGGMRRIRNVFNTTDISLLSAFLLVGCHAHTTHFLLHALRCPKLLA